jgi:hypothetical protein
MMMPKNEAIEFGAQVAALQKHYDTHTVVATVQRAVAEMAASIGYTPRDPDEDVEDDDIEPEDDELEQQTPVLEDDDERDEDGFEDEDDEDDDEDDEEDDDEDDEDYVEVEPAAVPEKRPLRGAAAKEEAQRALGRRARARS